MDISWEKKTWTYLKTRERFPRTSKYYVQCSNVLPKRTNFTSEYKDFFLLLFTFCSKVCVCERQIYCLVFFLLLLKRSKITPVARSSPCSSIAITLTAFVWGLKTCSRLSSNFCLDFLVLSCDGSTLFNASRRTTPSAKPAKSLVPVVSTWNTG